MANEHTFTLTQLITLLKRVTLYNIIEEGVNNNNTELPYVTLLKRVALCNTIEELCNTIEEGCPM